MRILREPAPEPSGGGTPTTPAATPAAAPPAPAAVVTPTPTPPATAVTIALAPDEYKRLLDGQSRLAEIEAETRRQLEEKENARLKSLAEKGQAEEAMAQLRTAKDAEIVKERERANALEREILTGHNAVAISRALDGIPWVSDEAARDARVILEARFEPVRDPATGKVASRERGTGRPAEDVIREWRASPASAHYQKPTTTGGAGASGTNHPAAPSPTETYEERRVRQIKEAAAARRTGAPGLDGTYGGTLAVRNN